MKRCTIIYNPNSGKGHFKDNLEKVQRYLDQEGFTWNIVETEYPKHATQLFEAAALENVDLVIVGGGDGTMNEISQSVLYLDNVPTIGYIPSGTANDLGKTLGLKKRLPKTLSVFKENEVRTMDILDSNFGVFNYIAAIGNYVDISYKTTKQMKRVWGFLAYVIFGIKAFFTSPIIQASIKTDRDRFSGKYSLILIVNSRYIAGFNLNPKCQLNDGEFEIILIPYVPILNNVYFFAVFLLKNFSLPGIVRAKATEIKVKTHHSRAWSLDGEVAQPGDFKAKIIKSKLPLIVNKDKVRGMFD
jgi:diacylglycerol kinase (ATP)